MIFLHKSPGTLICTQFCGNSVLTFNCKYGYKSRRLISIQSHLKYTIMKKIITLLFFAGLITTGFAQSGHRQQNNSQSNGNGYQSNRNSGNTHNQYSQSKGSGNYSDNQRNNAGTENDYAYNRDKGNQDGRVARGNQYDYPRYNQRGGEGHSYKFRDRESRHHKMDRYDNRN